MSRTIKEPKYYKTPPKLSTEERKAKIEELIKWQQPVFDILGVSDAVYIPKPIFVNEEKELCAHFFISELQGAKGHDIYTESVNTNWDPEYHVDNPKIKKLKTRLITNPNERRLFKWNYDSEWDKFPVRNGKVAIPIKDMIYIDRRAILDDLNHTVSNPELSFNDIMDPDQDCPMDQLSARDQMAIRGWVPVAAKAWINDIIKKYPNK